MDYATCSAADVIASVDDEEIKDILRRKAAAKAHLERLQDEMHFAEGHLADVEMQLARWVEETRRFMLNHAADGLLSAPEWAGLEGGES